MNNDAVVSPFPEYYAILDKVVDSFGSTEKSEAMTRARRQISQCSKLQIIAYLEAIYPVEEEKRRKSMRPTVLSLFFFRAFSIDLRKIKGLCVMLSRYATAEQVPLLIDALHCVDTRHAVKRKLAMLLPMYSQVDAPPLEDRLISVLARELRISFSSVVQQKNKAVIEREVSFVVAVLIYFERELALGRTLPKEVALILKRFANTPPNKFIPLSQWTMLQSAAQECLVFVGTQCQ